MYFSDFPHPFGVGDHLDVNLSPHGREDKRVPANSNAHDVWKRRSTTEHLAEGLGSWTKRLSFVVASLSVTTFTTFGGVARAIFLMSRSPRRRRPDVHVQ